MIDCYINLKHFLFAEILFNDIITEFLNLLYLMSFI